MIFVLGHRRVRWYASAASRSFSKTVRLSCSDSAFLTNCWAIVEAPSLEPPVASASTARAIPRRSTPGSVQNRRSSTDTIARLMYGEICWKLSIASWLGGANCPIRCQ